MSDPRSLRYRASTVLAVGTAVAVGAALSALAPVPSSPGPARAVAAVRTPPPVECSPNSVPGTSVRSLRAYEDGSVALRVRVPATDGRRFPALPATVVRVTGARPGTIAARD